MKKLAVALALALVACGSSPSPTDGPQAEQGAPPASGEPTPDPVAPAPAPTPQPAPACDPLTPRTKPLAIAVQPDTLAEPFVNAIGEAKTELRVMVYEMGFGPVLDALEAKAKAGVKLRVILDASQASVNQKYMDLLKADGADVIWSDPAFTYMHAKVIVVDDAKAVVSTGNYYIGNMKEERNYAVTDSDPADVKTLATLFDADFERKAPDLSCTRLLVAPVNAKQRLLDLIASANEELLVHSMQLGDRDVREAIVARKNAGVDVRVLLADPSWVDTNTDAASFLSQNGIQAKWLPHLHVKAVVIDGVRAYVGSENLSWTSLTKNREVGLVVTEAENIATMRTTFDTDWAAATAF